jgi:hypothetical protein
MTAAEILKVRETSKAGNGPWAARYTDKKGKEHKGWPEEMIKKTLVKRASKSWPQSGGRERLDKAVEVLNEHEGIELQETSVAYLQASPDQREIFQELLQGDDAPFAAWFNSQDPEIQASLYNSFPKGEITKGKQIVSAKEKSGLSILADIGIGIMETTDEDAIKEMLEDITDSEMEIVQGYLDSDKSFLCAELRMELAA